MQQIWDEGEVVQDWRDAEIVPIPKKGYLTECDNWRGISLLDVAGKVSARVLQEHLQVLAERVLPESQCGFRKGRGCIDMIFASRQLVEKCREHDDSFFVQFIDLGKHTTRVPRDASWRVLKKVGVPPTMLNIIRSFHDNMKAEVRVGDMVTHSIRVRNGLWQGCTLAPVLFNLYFNAVMACWRSRCPHAGVTVKFKHGRKLVGAVQQSQEKKSELKFADDVAVFATTRDALENATSQFILTASEWGLRVCVEKTKAMGTGWPSSPSRHL